MPRVSTFCPRCGEAIDTEVTEEARAAGRAALDCPACKFGFEIAPAARAKPAAPSAARGAPGWEKVSAPVDVAAAPSRAPATTYQLGSASGTTVVVRSFKPVAAAMMLFFASLLGLWMGSVLAFEDDVFTSGLQSYEGTGNFTGRVADGAGNPLAGVRVMMQAQNGTGPVLAETNTSAAGLYWFADLAPNVYRFQFALEGYRSLSLEAPAYPDQFTALFGAASPLGSVTMEEGDPVDMMFLSSVDRFNKIATGWGWFTLVASALAVAGAIAALKRRAFALALIGCLAGMATIGFLVGTTVSLVALVLIVLARKEFQPAQDPLAAPS